jgi:hypothetical protein
MMMRKCFYYATMFSAVWFQSVIPAAAAPSSDMVGKSFTVNWSESRQQRVNGSEVRSGNVSFQLQIYVGATGRPFTRLTSSSRGGVNSNDQVGGTGESLGGGARSVNANGNIISLQANFGNFARSGRIEVSGSGCSAQMSVGKEPGSASKPFRTPAGSSIEIQSVSVTGVSCSVQQGNAFSR